MHGQIKLNMEGGGNIFSQLLCCFVQSLPKTTTIAIMTFVFQDRNLQQKSSMINLAIIKYRINFK